MKEWLTLIGQEKNGRMGEKKGGGPDILATQGRGSEGALRGLHSVIAH